MENLYDILEVSPKASKEVIERAYKTLAKKYHPDLQVGKDKAKAEEKMKIINHAYSILGDESKRAEYDESLEVERQQQDIKYNNEHQNNNNSSYYSENTVYQNQYQNSRNTSQYEDASSKINPTWRDYYERLSPRDQRRVGRVIQRDARNEYRNLYEDYFRSLGYKVPHKWTWKEIKRIIIIVISLVAIFGILWAIPSTRNSMIAIYNSNVFVRLLVNLIWGILSGIIQFFKTILGIKNR